MTARKKMTMKAFVGCTLMCGMAGTEMTPGMSMSGFAVKSVTDLPEVKGRLARMTYEKNGADLAWLERMRPVALRRRSGGRVPPRPALRVEPFWMSDPLYLVTSALAVVSVGVFGRRFMGGFEAAGRRFPEGWRLAEDGSPYQTYT